MLWPESGWQPVSLTDLITAAAVKKCYRKATLCIHPDKVQQKGANLQQKYIAEKVFDLLKVQQIYCRFFILLCLEGFNLTMQDSFLVYYFGCFTFCCQFDDKLLLHANMNSEKYAIGVSRHRV